MNFSFYKRLDRRLVQKYHLYDKIYVEHRTNQKKHVVLHYSRDEDGEQFHEVDMPNVYAGIFVETFVVFFGEEIQYYITEEYKNKVVSTESNRLTCNDIYAQKDESRSDDCFPVDDLIFIFFGDVILDLLPKNTTNVSQNTHMTFGISTS